MPVRRTFISSLTVVALAVLAASTPEASPPWRDCLRDFAPLLFRQ